MASSRARWWIAITIGIATSGPPIIAQDDSAQQVAAESQTIIEAARFIRKEGRTEIDVPIRKDPVFQHIDSVRRERGAIWLVGWLAIRDGLLR